MIGVIRQLIKKFIFLQVFLDFVTLVTVSCCVFTFVRYNNSRNNVKVQKSPDKLNAKVYSIENCFLADPDPSGSEFAFGIRVNNPVPEQTNPLYRI